MDFELIGEIRNVETIASGHGIHILARLVRLYGQGKWRKLKGTAHVRLGDGTIAEAELHWFEAHGVGKHRMKISASLDDRIGMSDIDRHFAICIRNEGYEESLEVRKIYEVLGDPIAAEHDMLRVVDEEGEDYLYPSTWFLPIELPRNVEDALVELVHS